MEQTLTEEQLQQIEDKAGLMFDTSKVAIMLNIPQNLLLDGVGADSFLRGRYNQEARFRQVTRANALEGDTSSQKLFQEWITESTPDTDVS